MNKVWTVVPTALAVAALILAFVQRSDVRQLKRQLGETKGAGPAASGADLNTDRRLVSLERTVARIFEMHLAGRNRPGAQANASGNEAGGAKSEGASEDVEALLGGGALNTDEGRKQLHDIVRDVQQQVQTEQRQQRDQWQQQIQQERLQLLAKRANLNNNQVEQLTALLDAERQQRNELRQAAQQGGKPFTQFRAEMKTMHEATDNKAKQVLDSKQYEEYTKMRQAGRGRGGQRPQPAPAQ